jgi:uncharacterized protein (TIGR00661 family)
LTKFNILVSPLDWGLGHTTRLIPIIKALQSKHFAVTIAVCEKQKKCLEQEIENVIYEKIEGYNIKYATNKFLFSLYIVLQIPKILWSINKERKWVKNYVKHHKIDFILSDNRYGFYHKKIPSIFITHQLQIITGSRFLNKLVQKINYSFINKFSQCWIPDFEGEINIAGNLSHPKKTPKIPIKYIGSLNRFAIKNEASQKKYDICVLISGPEPQRSILEKIIVAQVEKVSRFRIIILRGMPQSINQLKLNNTNCIILNHLQGNELKQVLEQSEFIICRSGYTSLMELFGLQKKIIAIPTPAQTEQEYLAQYLQEKKLLIWFDQYAFKLENALEKANVFPFETIEKKDNSLEKAITTLTKLY